MVKVPRVGHPMLRRVGSSRSIRLAISGDVGEVLMRMWAAVSSRSWCLRPLVFAAALSVGLATRACAQGPATARGAPSVEEQLRRQDAMIAELREQNRQLAEQNR